MNSLTVWVIVLIVSVIAEAMTSALVSIWFIPSAIVCILLHLCGVTSLGIQIVVFLLVSALLAFLLRKKFVKSFNRAHLDTNTDALIGKSAVVEEELPKDGIGRVKIGGMSWAAYTEENRCVLRGERVTVKSISGVKLLCVPLAPNLPDESLVGKQARVEARIDNFTAVGTVICDGRTYLAKGFSEAPTVEAEDLVEIVALENEKVVCRPIQSNTTES